MRCRRNTSIPDATVVFLASLVVRLVLVAEHGWRSGWALADDNSELAWIARNLTAGRGFASPFGPGDSPTAWFAPLVPGLWAIVFRALGDSTPAAVAAILSINALASALSAVLYFRLLLRFLPAARVRGWHLLMLFAPVVFWPAALAGVTVPWYFCLQELAMACLGLALVEWVDRSFDRRGMLAVAASGVFAAYSNPSALVVLAGFCLAAGARGHPRPAALTGLAGVVALVALAMLPWTLRNERCMGRLVPMRSNFGVELRQGNNPNGSIVQTLSSLHPALDATERRRYDDMGEGAYTAMAASEGVRYMHAHPALTARRCLSRLYVFWCSDVTDRWPWTPRAPWWQGSAGERARWMLKIACHNLPWLAAAAALATGAWRRVRHAWLVALVALLFPLPYYLTHVSPDYAYPVQPYLLVFALAAALSRTSDGVKRVELEAP